MTKFYILLGHTATIASEAA